MSAHHTFTTPRARPHNVLPVALGLTLCFAGIEAAAGWWAGSLALLGDAGHMLTDSLALALATLAARLARTPPSHRHSFGLARIEVLAALVNAGFMLALVLGLSWNALARLAEPRPVAGEVVTWIAAAGLVLNIAVAWVLHARHTGPQYARRPAACGRRCLGLGGGAGLGPHRQPTPAGCRPTPCSPWSSAP
ncbi:MAG: cation diffusion facilitator family transporter [Rhodopseudomonas palustris]|nr:cation diffusion facilitator family transporter [Rhodopseudomonas palustris]